MCLEKRIKNWGRQYPKEIKTNQECCDLVVSNLKITADELVWDWHFIALLSRELLQIKSIIKSNLNKIIS